MLKLSEKMANTRCGYVLLRSAHKPRVGIENQRLRWAQSNRSSPYWEENVFLLVCRRTLNFSTQKEMENMLCLWARAFLTLTRKVSVLLMTCCFSQTNQCPHPPFLHSLTAKLPQVLRCSPVYHVPCSFRSPTRQITWRRPPKAAPNPALGQLVGYDGEKKQRQGSSIRLRVRSF